jgi:hypothetical protein
MKGIYLSSTITTSNHYLILSNNYLSLSNNYLSLSNDYLSYSSRPRNTIKYIQYNQPNKYNKNDESVIKYNNNSYSNIITDLIIELCVNKGYYIYIYLSI